MLCSNCSEVVKPVVAVDIDGTLGDYHYHFLSFLKEWLGRDHFNKMYGYGGAESFREWVEHAWDIDTETYRAAKLAYRQGGMKRSMPIYLGAQALCWAIRDRGAELWLTTTRPYLSLDSVVPDTVHWLKRYEIEYDHLLFDEDKYAKLRERVEPKRVVAILDDLGEMYDAAEEIFCGGRYDYHQPILIKTNYNRFVDRQMMSDLDAAADIVLARIDWWKEEHIAA